MYDSLLPCLGLRCLALSSFTGGSDLLGLVQIDPAHDRLGLCDGSRQGWVEGILVGDGGQALVDLLAFRSRGALHMIAFAAVTAVSVYVILDLEYPRVGLIRVDVADRVLSELRATMD